MSTNQIGSFRLGVDMKKLLPSKLYSDIFDDADITSNDASTIRVDRGETSAAFLNNGAFGRAYDRVQSVAIQLRQFAESNPDVFYDQVNIRKLTKELFAEKLRRCVFYKVQWFIIWSPRILTFTKLRKIIKNIKISTS
jgi:ABC-type phosphate/phosphonate transport system substrate-binding protein